MALSKVNFNSMNVTPAASKAIKFNSSNNGLETGDIGGSMVLISTQTASSSSTIDFTSGIDSTYKEYIFKFIDIHPATDGAEFTINFSTDSGSSFTGLTETSGTGVQPGGALVYWNVCTEVQFDVTNATTFRMRFEFFHQSNITLHGNSTRNTTCFNMIRLGDT